MPRIGIDGGRTHADAVLLNGGTVVAATKSLTSRDVGMGILDALETILAQDPDTERKAQAVMLGTTQFSNAVVERRGLAEVAATREIFRMLNAGIEKMKPSSDTLPVALVGGAVLVTEKLEAASTMLLPEHSGVANIIGAADKKQSFLRAERLAMDGKAGGWQSHQCRARDGMHEPIEASRRIRGVR